MGMTSHQDPARCQTCYRVMTTTDENEASCGCHITEPHRFQKGYGMHTCWACGKGGTAKIHRAVASAAGGAGR